MRAPLRLALLDYGAGNLTSVQKALAHVGFDVARATTAGDADGARALVIPGVGHYSAVATLLAGFESTILAGVERGVPVLGICLGLQVLFEGSDEAPEVPGLGLLAGRCFQLTGNVKVPHVGWNQVCVSRPSPLLDGVNGGSVYFTHSFAAPVTEAAVGVTTHGVTFASVVEHGRVFGVQWHPEKSGEAGLAVLRNFHRICQAC